MYSIEKVKISIIIPVYNVEKYISRCLDALINQTLNDIEIICVNDGSTDNSLEILENYAKKDDRIKVLSQKNSGPAVARNLGLKNVSGKYVMFCDSDDWYEPDMCYKMYEMIEKNNVDFVVCDCHVLDIGEMHFRSVLDFLYFHLFDLGKNILTDDIRLNLNVALWNKIFRKSLIDKYNISFPDGYEQDDDAFVYQYFCYSNTFYGSNLKLYNYVLYNNSIMGTFLSNRRKKHKFDCFYVWMFIYNSLKKNNLLDINISFLLRLLEQKYLFFIYPLCFHKFEKKLVLDSLSRILNLVSLEDLCVCNYLNLLKQKKYRSFVKKLEKYLQIYTIDFKLFSFSRKIISSEVRYYLNSILIKSKPSKNYYIQPYNLLVEN